MTLSVLYKYSSNLLVGNKINLLRCFNYNVNLCHNCGSRLFNGYSKINNSAVFRNYDRRRLLDLSKGRRYTTKNDTKTALPKEGASNANGAVVVTKVKLSKSNVKRLLSLARPEKWYLICKYSSILVTIYLNINSCDFLLKQGLTVF